MDNDFVEIARQFLFMVSGELQPYVSDKIEIDVSGNSVTLFAPSHVQFAKYGRAPGKQPPINKIIQFVKKKGIIFKNSTEEGTAWAIAKSIAKKGTKNYVPGAPNVFEEAINKHFENYVEEMSEHLLTSTERELNNIYLKMFPKSENI